MTKRREDILDRFNQVIAERNTVERDSKHYGQLSKIAKLILDELMVGNHERHVMYCTPAGYCYRCE